MSNDPAKFTPEELTDLAKMEKSPPDLNISDDMLTDIFERQFVLNERILGEKFLAMHGTFDEHTIIENGVARTIPGLRAEWVQKFALALAQENAELIDSVPWKWWSKHQKFDLQNARVEVVDMLHFLVSLAQVLGMNADDVHRMYVQKNTVNHKRQDSGYTTKDATDSSHIA
jgi:dimeric dUTPase (all-alpha-NTP-PPase superfamily)